MKHKGLTYCFCAVIYIVFVIYIILSQLLGHLINLIVR